MANFLMEQRADNLRDLESKSTAYFDANKDVFAGCMLPELNTGATASYDSKQQWVSQKANIPPLNHDGGEHMVKLFNVNFMEISMENVRCVIAVQIPSMKNVRCIIAVQNPRSCSTIPSSHIIC